MLYRVTQLQLLNHLPSTGVAATLAVTAPARLDCTIPMACVVETEVPLLR